ncbi:hypothetical protein BS78_05G285100 [Paspalum vaginatum]|nr:hypothetical protein BS78_05G285100 [Paspalum vaginatum]
MHAATPSSPPPPPTTPTASPPPPPATDSPPPASASSALDAASWSSASRRALSARPCSCTATCRGRHLGDQAIRQPAPALRGSSGAADPGPPQARAPPCIRKNLITYVRTVTVDNPMPDLAWLPFRRGPPLL